MRRRDFDDKCVRTIRGMSEAPPQYTTRPFAKVHTVFDDRDTVHTDERDSVRELIGVLEGSAIANGGWIEEHEVRERAGADFTAIDEPELRRRKARHAMDGLLEKWRVAFVPILSSIAVIARCRSFGIFLKVTPGTISHEEKPIGSIG